MKTSYGRAAVLLISLILVLCIPASRLAQNSPITKEGLIHGLNQLRPGQSQAALIAKVNLRGVDFELNPDTERELRRAGATEQLLLAVSRIRPRPSPSPTPTPAPAPTPPETFIEQFDGLTLETVLIHGKQFQMGTPERDAIRNTMETPQHPVTPGDFYIGRTEVTQLVYATVMGKNPSQFRGERRPVENISWNDATEFCRALTRRTHHAYRLPSESEWEYAARANSVFPADKDKNVLGEKMRNIAWCSPFADFETHDVATRDPNAWGLYDMFGNVAEWCEDLYHQDYIGAPRNGSPWITGDSGIPDSPVLRVVRGGSYSSGFTECRPAIRATAEPDKSYITVGFRVVMDVSSLRKSVEESAKPAPLQDFSGDWEFDAAQSTRGSYGGAYRVVWQIVQTSDELTLKINVLDFGGRPRNESSSYQLDGTDTRKVNPVDRTATSFRASRLERGTLDLSRTDVNGETHYRLNLISTDLLKVNETKLGPKPAEGTTAKDLFFRRQ